MKTVLCFPQIVLLIAFMCITLLVASLVCLTLPGELELILLRIVYPVFNNVSSTCVFSQRCLPFFMFFTLLLL